MSVDVAALAKPCGQCFVHETAHASGICAQCRQDGPPRPWHGTWRNDGGIMRPVELVATPTPPPARPCCTDCGCVLARRDEVCPSCIVWAERDAVRASWLGEWWAA